MSRSFRQFVALLAVLIAIVGLGRFYYELPRGAEAVAPNNQAHEISVAGRHFQISLDGCVVKGENGVETERKFSPPATWETLAKRLREMGERDAVFPIVYEEGARKKRQLMTSLVTIRLP